MKLQNCHEIVGLLRDVKNENGTIKFIFAIETEVEITDQAFSFTELKKHVYIKHMFL